MGEYEHRIFNDKLWNKTKALNKVQIDKFTIGEKEISGDPEKSDSEIQAGKILIKKAIKLG